MELVCETCGGSGFSDCLIICQKCSSYAVHRYCLGEVKLSDAEVDWHCEYCRLKCSKITLITKQDFTANEVKKNNASGTFSLTVTVKQTSNATKNMVSKRKRRRRLILEDEDVDEDVVPSGADLNVDKNKMPEVQSGRDHPSLESYANDDKKFDIRGCTYTESSLRNVDNGLLQSLGFEVNVPNNISYRPTLNNASNDMPGCPLSDPVWSGSFLIREHQYGEMKAHLSDIACERASSEARNMPTMLPLRIHQRSDVWPRSFQTSPPHGEHIAVYFFPVIAKDGDPFTELLDYLINSDLALKSCLDNSELLLFPSLQLPEPYHCFEERYYIWGIFKNRRSEESPHVDANLGEGRASLLLSDHMPGKINDSVDPLPSPSLCSPTPDDIHQHELADSVENKSMSISEDSITRKILLPPTLLPHHQRAESSDCGIKKLGTDATTKNAVLPVDMEACCPLVGKIGLCQDYNSSLELLPVLSNAQDDGPKVENLQPELGEGQHDTSNCLDLFPLVVEDLAVVVRLRDNGEINLELGLGRQIALKQDAYMDNKNLEKHLECGRSLLS